MADSWISVYNRLYKSPDFDADFYQRRYHDVSLSGMPGLEHYAKYGVLLNREIRPFNTFSDFVQPSPNSRESCKSDDVTLTVICTTYNHAKFIRQTLDGFVTQSVDFKFEVLISDDCSTDETPDIIAEYAQVYPFITHIRREKNIGSVPNLLDLASRVRSKYVAICEGDDYWTDPNKIKLQVEFLETHPGYSICFHPVKVSYEDDPEREEYFPNGLNNEFTADRLAYANFIQTNSVMYRWRFNGHLPSEFAKIHPGDWYLHLLHAEIGRIGFIDKPMAVYRKHSGGMWADAEVNTIALHKRFGAGQLRMFEALKSRFGGKYHDRMKENQQYIMGAVLTDLLMQNDVQPLADFVYSTSPLQQGMLKLCGIQTCNDSLDRDDIVSMLRSALKISVVVTCYNHASFLRRCLDSILMQKGAFELEIIIGDDSSTDSSQIIIDDYCAKYPGVIRQMRDAKNLRMLKNMKRCFAAARMPFIAMCEGDDYWISEYKLAKQLAYLCLNQKCSMVFNWLLLSEENGERLIPHHGQSNIVGDKILFSHLALSPVTANFSACMYRASTIAAIPDCYFEQDDAADWLFNLYAAKVGYIGFIPELLSVYRVHKSGQWSGLSLAQQRRRVEETKLDFLQLFGVANGFNEEIGKFSVTDLMSKEKSEFVGYIDAPVGGEQFNVKNGQIEVRGWAVGKLGGPVDVVIERDGVALNYRTIVGRADVVRFLKDSSNLEIIDDRCGFSIIVPYQTNMSFKVGVRIRGKTIWWKEIVCCPP